MSFVPRKKLAGNCGGKVLVVIADEYAEKVSVSARRGVTPSEAKTVT